MVTTRTEIKKLQPGRYVIIDEEPCKVLGVTTSVSGKHGEAKARLEVVGLFDNKRRSIVKPADAEMEIPIIEKKTGQVVAISGNNAQIMDMTDYEIFDIPIPEELKEKMAQGKEILYWVVMDRKMITEVKG
jgi:translation initiation factor 5A